MEKTKGTNGIGLMNGIIPLLSSIVNRPLCPTLIHDEFTRGFIIGSTIVISLTLLYRIMKYYGSP